MNISYKEAKEILKKYNQEHLIENYEDLNDETQKKLLKQISKINFEEINNLYRKAISGVESESKNIEPIEYVDKRTISKEIKQKYEEKGIEIIKNGKLAIVTMAGGQGTRLRTQRSKGNIYARCRAR